MAVRGDRIIGQRLAGGRPVLGICVGMQILFERGVEFGRRGGRLRGVAGHGRASRGRTCCRTWGGTVDAPEDSVLFAGMDPETRFYFVHSYGVRKWELPPSDIIAPPKLTWAEHGDRFLAAVENGALSATQFHPEKSGDAGAQLLENWVRSL
ncbi:imidazole glycerol phosphate synthase subunit HisH [Rhodococcus hoagii]|nr:imidazole glycerol phosphate synthase subunit HisH [Prescottella equi]